MGLNRVAKDGTTSTDEVVVIQQVQLNKLFKIIESTQRLKTLSAYPMALVMGDGLYSAATVIAINSAFGQSKPVPSESVYIQDAPSTKVVVQADEICKGELTFVPWTTSVKPHKDGGIYATVEYNGEVHQFDLDRPCAKTYLLEFWKLRRVGDKDNANMSIEMIDVAVPLPKLGKSMAKSMIAKVLTAVLFKDVHKGDELVLYVYYKPKVAGEKRSLPTVCKPAAKAKHTI